MRVQHSFQEIVGKFGITFPGKKIIQSPVFTAQCAARFINKGLTRQIKQFTVTGNIGNKPVFFTTRQVADQGMGGVMTVQLGFLEGKQVLLLLEKP